MQSVLVVRQLTPSRLIAVRGAPGGPGTSGTNAREVELQVSATHIQWRYAGAATWTDLLALVDLEGAPGDPGDSVELQTSATHIQWRPVGAVTWTDLIALSALKGTDGLDAVMLPFPVQNDASTALTFGLTHASTYHRVTAATAATRTVPPQSSVAWPDNTEIQIEQAGAGAVSIVAGSGVTINRLAGTNAVIAGQYGAVALKRVAADVWTLIGALEASA